MAKVYTKTGDLGQTSLYGGTRISKDSLQVNTYGAIDRANASIGVAKSNLKDKNLKDILNICQIKLFEVAAYVASDESGRKKLENNIRKEDVSFVEKTIDLLTSDLEKVDYFIIPGNSVESSLLHSARVDIRAAERKLVEFSKNSNGYGIYLEFLNRLSDLIYTIARYVDEVLNTYRLKESNDMKFLSIARRIEEACFKKAQEINVPMAVAITDNAGEVISFGVMEDTLRISYKLSKDKAYTAAVLKMQTEDLCKVANPGQSLYGIENADNIVIFGGGIPLFIDDKLVGAIGISGGSVEEDILVAKAGEEEFYKGYGRE